MSSSQALAYGFFRASIQDAVGLATDLRKTALHVPKATTARAAAMKDTSVGFMPDPFEKMRKTPWRRFAQRTVRTLGKGADRKMRRRLPVRKPAWIQRASSEQEPSDVTWEGKQRQGPWFILDLLYGTWSTGKQCLFHRPRDEKTTVKMTCHNTRSRFKNLSFLGNDRDWSHDRRVHEADA